MASELSHFEEQLKQLHLRGQWQGASDDDQGVVYPKPQGIPMVWHWDVMFANLEKAARLLPESFTARRHLAYQNPGLNRNGTTHTLSAGLQLVRPGELAWAHRHTMSAIRLVVEGSPRAFTVVDGEPCTMEAFDLILTPGWSWHDHHNPGDEPVIWLDALDVPLVGALSATFYEPLGQKQQRVRGHQAEFIQHRMGWVRPTWEAPSRGRLPVRYAWKSVRQHLDRLSGADGSPFDGVSLEYVNPVTGGPTLPTLSCWVQRLAPGQVTQSHRHTSSAIYFVISGRGATEIEGQWHEWGPKDGLALPNWMWHRHANRSESEEAILFSVQDTPVLQALGLYHEEPEMSQHRRSAPSVPTISPEFHKDAFVP